MFTPNDFSETLQRFRAELRASREDYSFPKPRVEYSDYGRWREIRWDCEILLKSGRLLVFNEIHSLEKFTHLRMVCFRFLNEGRLPIFIVDTHGRATTVEHCPHLEYGHPKKKRLEDGDPRLNGLKLRDFTVIDMWRLVRAYEDRQEVPWAAN